MQGSIKEAHGRGFEEMHRYEMRSKKGKIPADHIKYATNHEQGLKEKGKKKVLIKPKKEADEAIKENHHVQALKQKIQTL